MATSSIDGKSSRELACYVDSESMTPRTKPARQREFRPSPKDEGELRTALTEIEGGQVVELTEEQLRHWEETGEWPTHITGEVV
jgi:hypothetical protein